jgi:predicted cupin superfamily sugar epimerase
MKILSIFVLAYISFNAQGDLKMVTAEDVIKRFDLKPLPGEGGFYTESHRDEILISTEDGLTNSRIASTAIYYLVTPESFSALHRLPKTEIFHFYGGDPVDMVQITEDGKIDHFTLGSDFMNGQQVQVVVPKGVWQSTKLLSGGNWALMGTTVAPGFDFQDLEIADQDVLIKRYPALCRAILSHTRE